MRCTLNQPGDVMSRSVPLNVSTIAARRLLLLCTVSVIIAVPTQAQYSYRHSYFGGGVGLVSGSGFRLYSAVAEPFRGGSGPIRTGFWRVSQEATTTGVDDVPEEFMPARYGLEANHPNPFIRGTTISYALPQAARVRLAVFDVLGRRVTTLKDVEESPGRYEVLWNGHDDGGRPVASGTYLCRMETGEFVKTRAMLLVR